MDVPPLRYFPTESLDVAELDEARTEEETPPEDVSSLDDVSESEEVVPLEILLALIDEERRLPERAAAALDVPL